VSSIKTELEQILKPPAPEPVVPKTTKRTLGNIHVALEAQRIYNPAMPLIPKPTPAPSKPEDQGVAPKLGTDGRWGTPGK
jgi:hypothetical protein